jgi:hypothetical protein
MKTVVISIPDKKEKLVTSFLKKNRLKSRILSEEDKEEMALAEWIDEGMKSKAVAVEKVLDHLRKHGVNC